MDNWIHRSSEMTCETCMFYCNAIAQKSKELMEIILLNCPDSIDRLEALANVRSARMWANASIVLQNKRLSEIF